MAEWKDVIHQIVRICKLQKGACGTCILSAESCPNSVRFDLNDEAGFVNIEKAIMTWAAANPEPVYPTWRDFLAEKGELCKNWKDIRVISTTGNGVSGVIGWFYKNIPADVAQKLGIEPKDGV